MNKVKMPSSLRAVNVTTAAAIVNTIVTAECLKVSCAKAVEYETQWLKDVQTFGTFLDDRDVGNFLKNFPGALSTFRKQVSDHLEFLSEIKDEDYYKNRLIKVLQHLQDQLKLYDSLI